MAEGTQHRSYVKQLYNFIINLVPSKNKGLIIVDNEGFSHPIPIFDSVIPDISYYFGNEMILGEAKSMNDYDRPHSIRQYRAYVSTCEAFEGNATFILYLHWDTFLNAQKLIRKMLPKPHKAEYIIVSSNGKVARL